MRRSGHCGCLSELFAMLFIAAVGTLCIVEPILLFGFAWFDLLPTNEAVTQAAVPPWFRILLFVVLHAAGFAAVFGVEVMAGPARLSLDNLIEDLEHRRGRPILYRTCWLAGAMIAGTMLFCCLPLARMELNAALGMVWTGACAAVLLAAAAAVSCLCKLRLALCPAAIRRR